MKVIRMFMILNSFDLLLGLWVNSNGQRVTDSEMGVIEVAHLKLIIIRVMQKKSSSF